jgi:hypothetical protein
MRALRVRRGLVELGVGGYGRADAFCGSPEARLADQALDRCADRIWLRAGGDASARRAEAPPAVA